MSFFKIASIFRFDSPAISSWLGLRVWVVQLRRSQLLQRTGKAQRHQVHYMVRTVTIWIPEIRLASATFYVTLKLWQILSTADHFDCTVGIQIADLRSIQMAQSCPFIHGCLIQMLPEYQTDLQIVGIQNSNQNVLVFKVGLIKDLWWTFWVCGCPVFESPL